MFLKSRFQMFSGSDHYISLSTRKRNGKFVDTPVWFACETEGHRIYIYTVKNSGKVKRIRNFSDVQVAKCNVVGKINGSWIKAHAALIDEEQEITTAFYLLKKKYGYRFLIANLCSRIVGNYHRRQIIRCDILE